MPWNEIKIKVPASAKRIRGKLNVPRERFHPDSLRLIRDLRQAQDDGSTGPDFMRDGDKIAHSP